MTIRTGLLASAILAATAGHAFAFVYTSCLDEKIKWSSNSVTLRADPTSFPSGYWRNGMDDTITKFNRNPSNFRYSLATDSGGVGLGNGQNEVWGSTDNGVLDGAPAIAYTWRDCYWFFGNHVGMTEVDVIYDYHDTASNPFEWTASTSKANLTRYLGSGREIQTTGIHELGHGLKLKHVNTEYNVMGADFEHIHVNGSTATAYLGEDAADGAVFLYGTRSETWEDLGVVHWKFAGASGEYSDHDKTQMFNSSNAVLATVNVAGETGYRVNRGQAVKAEFTYENNGKSTKTVNIGYYVSTNDTITTGDTKIGSVSMTLSRGDVYTSRTQLTIPSNLSLNTNYWIGAIIDDNNAVTEKVETNNATYIPIRVQ
ncbi:hypothetical protein [Oryzibacter oryziterrae]|uniref:hypothetical protein n=1 Tax=Oryzibacter oryziterrae TaxID=2766474 RepID=UPI001F2C94CD|nr:hypothetical protein [Oryzibacter oryziterrae]